MYYRVYELPWSLGDEDERRFWRILRNVAIALALVGFLLPFLPLPKPDRSQAPVIPARLARVVIERQAPPPPPPPPPQVVEAKPPPAALPERTVKEPPKPEPQIDKVEQARRKAASSGLLQLQNELADLRDNSAADKALQAKNLSGAVGETARAERSLITSTVGKGSGGINTAALSRGVGGGAGSLVGHSTGQVEAPTALASGGGEARRNSSSNKASRSREEIELVFDKNKSAIYALYSRALRDNPSLQGKLVLQITIAPSGEVTACSVVSSDLNDPELERKLVSRIRLFRFEEKDVEAITTTKPIDFFPA
ncbi:MAG: AgmX/PglI C-terminal domain-containing protein [Steroidobacteraceae bacterium]